MRAAVVAMLLSASAGPAGAASLSITGPYGDAAGCAYARQGESQVDSLILLRPDRIEFYETGCAFLQVWPAGEGTEVALASCVGEGVYEVRHYTVTPDYEDANKRMLFAADGQLAGILEPCR